MKRTGLLLSIFLLLGGYIRAQQKAQPSYSRDYSVVVGGAPAGTEKVTEVLNRDGSIVSTSTHEIFVLEAGETKRMAFQTELTLEKTTLAPLRYTCVYTSGDTHDSYDVTVAGGEISRMLIRGGKTSESKSPVTPGLMLVDINVYHHLDYVIRKYDQKKRGRQSFQNFLPVIAVQMPLSITRLPDSSLKLPGREEEDQLYRVEFGSLWTGELAAGKDSRLLRLSIRDKGIEVVKQESAPKKE